MDFFSPPWFSWNRPLSPKDTVSRHPLSGGCWFSNNPTPWGSGVGWQPVCPQSLFQTTIPPCSWGREGWNLLRQGSATLRKGVHLPCRCCLLTSSWPLALLGHLAPGSWLLSRAVALLLLPVPASDRVLTARPPCAKHCECVFHLFLMQAVGGVICHTSQVKRLRLRPMN